MEIESCYLLGEFDVRRVAEKGKKPGPPQFLLTAPSFSTSSGDLTERGMPFYRGAVTYRQNLDQPRRASHRCFLELNEPRAAIAEVAINGERAGLVAWPPWRVEVTDLLKAGENEIEITLYGTCRNLLGPHHHIEGELISVGPASFSSNPPPSAGGRKKTWTDDYSFVPFGLLGGASLVFTRLS